MIDAHIHLDDKRFDDNRGELIQQAKETGITQFIVPAIMASGFQKLLHLSNQYDCIKPSYGLHPYFSKHHSTQDLDTLDIWLSANQSCALGECGLDYFVKDLDRQTQQFYFEAQIALAKKYKLPLILHARNAVDAVFNTLKRANYFNAMIHSYNGSIQQTKVLLDKGMKFSFGGAICNPNAQKLHKLVQYIPTDAIMFETDAPDQNLYPNFKETNTPINLLKIIEQYSQLKQTDFDDSSHNALQVTRKFFKIPTHDR